MLDNDFATDKLVLVTFTETVLSGSFGRTLEDSSKEVSVALALEAVSSFAAAENSMVSPFLTVACFAAKIDRIAPVLRAKNKNH